MGLLTYIRMEDGRIIVMNLVCVNEGCDSSVTTVDKTRQEQVREESWTGGMK